MFQSAPPVKGATFLRERDIATQPVSIRAPREGGDSQPLAYLPPSNVSIRAPREGGDGDGFGYWLVGVVSIRAPREGGDAGDIAADWQNLVSIRAPREGGDFSGCGITQTIAPFQSAPPVKGATNRPPLQGSSGAVSIRAPREGGDRLPRA